MVEKNTDPDKALLKAIKSGDLKGAKHAIADGADINLKYKNGYTPLHTAIIKRRADVALYLIENGADINVDSKRYRASPLIWAIYKRQSTVALALIDKGADITKKNSNGHTALDMSRMQNLAEITVHLSDIMEKNSALERQKKYPALHVVNPYTAAKVEGVIPDLGPYRKIFNFKAATVTEVFETSAGPAASFETLNAEQLDEVAEMHEFLKAQGYDLPTPQKEKKPIKVLKKQSNSRT